MSDNETKVNDCEVVPATVPGVLDSKTPSLSTKTTAQDDQALKNINYKTKPKIN
jgi:hypothetical protein